MDPYLEAPAMWPDVHNSLIYAIRDQIQPRLSPHYRAVITPYVSLEQLAIAPGRRAIVPDVAVVERSEEQPESGSAPIATAPLTLTAPMQIPTRLARLEVRAVDAGTLVTIIELLSPANKREGADGAAAYEQKRQQVFRSDVHLMEIDLLRGGKRPRLVQALPAAPYFIFLSRANRRPEVEVWPLLLHKAIDTVPLPLQAGEPDVPLDLNLALREIYASARYDLDIDYSASPPPPDLAPEDAAWLDVHLRERGLR
jgi:hypothetical protein